MSSRRWHVAGQVGRSTTCIPPLAHRLARFWTIEIPGDGIQVNLGKGVASIPQPRVLEHEHQSGPGRGHYCEPGAYPLRATTIRYPLRMSVIEELILYMRSHAGVWFATDEDIARYVKAQACMG
jgi:hypothetical protein